MTTKKKNQKRLFAVVNRGRRIAETIRKGRLLVEKMTGNADFPSPNPPLSTLSTGLDALDAAETAAKTRALGKVEARDVQLTAVVAVIDAETAYVQSIADANPSRADEIITGAGLAVQRSAIRTKSAFAVSQGATSGTARLVAKAVGARSAYEWQMSTDGKTWTSLPSTVAARTIVSGLAPATTYGFRMRAISRSGVSDWSQVVELLVR